jgi:hypothetical protein
VTVTIIVTVQILALSLVAGECSCYDFFLLSWRKDIASDRAARCKTSSQQSSHRNGGYVLLSSELQVCVAVMILTYLGKEIRSIDDIITKRFWTCDRGEAMVFSQLLV